MEDGGVLYRLKRFGVQRRARMRGPSRKATYQLIAPRGNLRLVWWPVGDVRAVSWRPRESGGGYAVDPIPTWRKTKMKRVKQLTGEEAPVSVASQAPGGFDKFPGLNAHQSGTKYDDGAPRRPGSVRSYTEGSEWCVRVSDPDSCCSFVARGETWWDAMLLAELLVTAERCPWAPDSFLQDQAARKKKK